MFSIDIFCEYKQKKARTEAWGQQYQQHQQKNMRQQDQPEPVPEQPPEKQHPPVKPKEPPAVPEPEVEEEQPLEEDAVMVDQDKRPLTQEWDRKSMQVRQFTLSARGPSLYVRI